MNENDDDLDLNRLDHRFFHASFPRDERERMRAIWERVRAGTSTPEDAQFLLRSTFHYAHRAKKYPRLRRHIASLEQQIQRLKYGHGRSDFQRVVIEHANGRTSFVCHRQPWLNVGDAIKFQEETAHVVSIEDCERRRMP